MIVLKEEFDPFSFSDLVPSPPAAVAVCERSPFLLFFFSEFLFVN